LCFLIVYFPGYFVHHVCDQLLDIINQSSIKEDGVIIKRARTDDVALLATTSHHIDIAVGDEPSLCELDVSDFQKLLVKDKDGRAVLFCDQG